MKLRVNNITKQYGGKPVLSGCSYDFDTAGVYVLMGPNGCGKSTFLRICALLERPDAGELAFLDHSAPLPHDIHLRRRMTLVLPKTGVFNTTVFRNAAYGLQVRGFAPAMIEERASRALALVGLEHRRKQNALTLSSGETQRLGLARALAIEPDILFLDEPTAAVDEANTEIIENIIKTLKRQGHTLVIMTTHDRDQAERLADDLLVFREGALQRPS